MSSYSEDGCCCCFRWMQTLLTLLWEWKRVNCSCSVLFLIFWLWAVWKLMSLLLHSFGYDTISGWREHVAWHASTVCQSVWLNMGCLVDTCTSADLLHWQIFWRRRRRSEDFSRVGVPACSRQPDPGPDECSDSQSEGRRWWLIEWF